MTRRMMDNYDFDVERLIVVAIQKYAFAAVRVTCVRNAVERRCRIHLTIAQACGCTLHRSLMSGIRQMVSRVLRYGSAVFQRKEVG